MEATTSQKRELSKNSTLSLSGKEADAGPQQGACHWRTPLFEGEKNNSLVKNAKVETVQVEKHLFIPQGALVSCGNMRTVHL